jgi:hypothetical protein
MYLNYLPLLVALALPGDLPSHTGVPMMRIAEPDSGKIGDILEIQGENLAQDNVKTVYLTDENTDIKVVIVDQTASSIRFRIPPSAKPGRFTIMVLTTDQPPRLIEEPVKVTVLPETAGSDGSVN